MPSSKRKFGDIGENIACMFLEKHGFRIFERNYLKKWGEIDIIAKRGDSYRFIEVKSVSTDLSHGKQEYIRAEENMHPGKLKRLYRTIETYILERQIDADWQLDLVIVKIDPNDRKAKVEIIENIA